MSDFEGKVAFVTGAGSGIGEATARHLHREGAKVFLAVRTEQQAERLSGELAGARAAAIEVRDVASVERVVAQAVSAFGRLDFCVNCAGITGPAQTSVPDYDAGIWADVIATDLSGLFHCMKYEIPALLKTGGGSIANMSSANGIVGIAGMAAYTAAKHGVIGLTRSAALECAGKGIRVNAVAPGYVQTPKVLAAGQEALDFFAREHPMGRLARAEEVADMILFLLSERSAFATGGVFTLDGGYTAQ